jgi:NADH:ubiquinone oxidoreductase subunit E
MPRLKICTGRACTDHGSKYLFDRAKAEQAEAKNPITLEPCACLGRCETAANVRAESQDKTVDYAHVDGPKIATIIKQILTK